MRHSAWIACWIAGAAVAGAAVFFTLHTPAYAAKGDQVGRGKNVPEVPVAALLPAASGLSGGGYYLVSRLRNRRTRDE